MRIEEEEGRKKRRKDGGVKRKPGRAYAKGLI